MVRGALRQKEVWREMRRQLGRECPRYKCNDEARNTTLELCMMIREMNFSEYVRIESVWLIKQLIAFFLNPQTSPAGLPAELTRSLM